MSTPTDALDAFPGARAAAQRMSFDGETLDFSGGFIGDLDPADFSIVAPRIGSMRGTVGVHIGTATWALPSRCRVSPGRGVLFVVGPDDAMHVLVGRDGRVRELLVPDDFAERIRRERFDRRP